MQQWHLSNISVTKMVLTDTEGKQNISQVARKLINEMLVTSSINIWHLLMGFIIHHLIAVNSHMIWIKIRKKNYWIKKISFEYQILKMTLITLWTNTVCVDGKALIQTMTFVDTQTIKLESCIYRRLVLNDSTYPYCTYHQNNVKVTGTTINYQTLIFAHKSLS